MAIGHESYDAKCYELAEYFLEGEEDPTGLMKSALAGVIQEAVEDFFSALEEDSEADGEPDDRFLATDDLHREAEARKLK